MKKAIKELVALAKQNANANTWRAVVRAMDLLSPSDQEEAADAFNEASAHWPTGEYDPYQVKQHEVRVSPVQYGWSQEIVSGASYPKHRLLRSLHLPSNRWEKHWKALNLHASTNLSNITSVDLTLMDKNPVSAEMMKEWQGKGMWQSWQHLRLAHITKAQTKELAKARLDSLRSLHLHVKPGALEGLWKAEALPKLEELMLSGLEDAAEVDALAKVRWIKGLKGLGLQYVISDEARMSAVADACGLEGLAQLEITINRMSTSILTIPLRWMEKLKALKRLTLNMVRWFEADMAPMLEGLPALEELNAIQVELGMQSAQAIAQHKGKWRALAFRDLGADGDDSLATILQASSTDELELIHCGKGLGPKSIRLLADGACPKLKAFRCNGLSPEVEDFLKKNPKLRALTVEANYNHADDNGYPHEELKLA